MTGEYDRKTVSELGNYSEKIILGSLKNDILSGPIMEQPDPLGGFYPNSYGSKDRIGDEIIQKGLIIRSPCSR